MTLTGTAAGSFVHEGLFYRGRQGLLAGVVPFVVDGLAVDEPVLVAMPEPHLGLVRSAVGAPERVTWVDMGVAGRNPGRIIPWVLQAFVDRYAGRRVRLVGEPVWVGRSADEYGPCVQHEAMINEAFVGRPATILCPYDAAGLDARVLDDACATHPVIMDPPVRRLSPGYAPAKAVARYNTPPPPPTQPVAALPYDAATLPQVRRFAAGHAHAAGLTGDQVADLEIAATELATNSVTHAGGGGLLRVWTTDEHLVCEFQDDGWLADPLTGRLNPASDGVGGRGLVIVHALCDLVLLHTGVTGTTVRLHLRRPG